MGVARRRELHWEIPGALRLLKLSGAIAAGVGYDPRKGGLA